MKKRETVTYWFINKDEKIEAVELGPKEVRVPTPPAVSASGLEGLVLMSMFKRRWWTVFTTERAAQEALLLKLELDVRLATKSVENAQRRLTGHQQRLDMLRHMLELEEVPAQIRSLYHEVK